LDISVPIHIPGTITASIDSELASDLKSPLKVSVVIQKKVGFLWVDVPCIDNLGSCSYQDFCSILPFSPDKPCPDPFDKLGLPC